MTLEEEFNKAANAMRALTTKPSDDDLLEIYALYKQSMVGDCNTAKPGLTDLKGRAKWETWNGKKGVSQDAAKQQYITLAKTLGSF